MHLVPADRAGRQPIDEHAACEAIEAIGDPRRVSALADRFALLGDPSRLALLIAIRRVGPIAVSDLALGTGINDTTVSHALRLLRSSGVVQAERDGRVVRYRLADDEVAALLDAARGPAEGGPVHSVG